jgi:magnesium transporter
MGRLLRLRLPWLVVGLVIGMAGSMLMAQFEKLLSQNISLAFFVPIVVYMSDAVGTQTETIFVRDLAGKKVNFAKYLAKEMILGGYMGLV